MNSASPQGSSKRRGWLRDSALQQPGITRIRFLEVAPALPLLRKLTA
ncbi:hypothetical protein [Streptomyces sp. MBT62]|nr:hypothetical protein [Streptomyces sp. MBT62]MBK3564839.1 hypothetical protein [Streptomyces sp. MBT62]